MTDQKEIQTFDAEIVETGSAVAVSQDRPVAVAKSEASPYALVMRAVETGADIATIERLLALQERVEATAARRAFDNAIAEAKANIGPIEKNRRVLFESAKGKTDYRFEDLASIAAAVDPELSKVGLSYRFRTSQANGNLSVACVLSHRDGYSEETTLSAGYDQSGNKNPIQAIGSAMQYLMRYTLKAALGLSVANDDDGQATTKQAAVEDLTGKQVAELRRLVEETKSDMSAFLKVAKADSLEEIRPANFEALKARLLQKKAQQQAQS